jgi:hypothetical protein
LTFTILTDEKSGAAKTYQIRGIPTSFFIDREGVIQAKHVGPLNETLIDKQAQNLLR